MDRRKFLQGLVGGCTLLTSGCTTELSSSNSTLEKSDVFKDYYYEGTKLFIVFRDDVDVQEAILFSRKDEYETVKNPPTNTNFTVIHPNKLDTYLSRRPPLRVKAKIENNWIEKSVWEPVHGATRNIEILQDGSIRFEVENLGNASLLMRFVGVYGDVPNPTIDPQSESFDTEASDLGPGIVGIEENRAEPSSRTDLVISPGETVPFETVFAPFEASNVNCDGTERNATIAIVHASGGIATYTFSFRLDGSQIESGNNPDELTTHRVCSVSKTI
ncbi:hypothetical protein [Natrinema hispanicum]|uniref:Lipoprotein n=1 Tax=Natrinema hispanicum TaxID=392421 RepID=A0A1I0IXA0_9EURY|nr:hypothetical protein [Natrinema hispanicum]SDD96100.1 hypothetical protein SAMN05192552_10812 [Natrinema hispanicum]SEU02047.1 hypothetical protein SAMN04488694_12728 [Natrinema hispanicum]